MTYTVIITPAARRDLVRLYSYLVEQAKTLEDLELAERALQAINTAVNDQLKRAPYIYRKLVATGEARRELVISFGRTGYVALYEIVEPDTVLVLAVRHQREAGY